MKLILEGSYQDIMDFIGQTVLKTPDSVIPEGSEPDGYGARIYQRLEEKLRKKDSVSIPAQASGLDPDRKKIKPKTNSVLPDPHLDVHGGLD